MAGRLNEEGEAAGWLMSTIVIALLLSQQQLVATEKGF